MGMDVMECCLHTLRLHWVEYQSKFYKGDGHKYNEFSFKEVTHSAESWLPFNDLLNNNDYTKTVPETYFIRA